MNKKLLTTAIAAALAGGMTAAATADVRLGGRIDVSIDSIDFDYFDYDDINMNSNTSYFYIDGSEDLGNGLKGIFRVSFGFCPDTTGNDFGYGGGLFGYGGAYGCDGGEGNTLYDRDQYLGLSGGFGTVRLGSIFTPYYEHGAAIDPLFGTSLQGRNGGLQSPFGHSEEGDESAFHGLATNTVRYDSPDISGFGVSAFYSFDSRDDDSSDDDAWGIGGQYQTGNILAFADYQTSQENDLKEDSAWKVGGKFSMDSFAVYAQYEDLGNQLWFGDDEFADAKIWTLAGSFTMGNTMLYLGYGNGNDEAGDFDAWTIAARHSLSSRTGVYAGWNQIDIDSLGEVDHIAIGVNHTF
jgi:predicted porin